MADSVTPRWQVVTSRGGYALAEALTQREGTFLYIRAEGEDGTFMQKLAKFLNEKEEDKK